MFSNTKIKFSVLVSLTVIFNFYIFLLSYLNYNSTRGTDYDKYGPYLEYFTFGLDSKLQEQGVGYFWFVSSISKLQINSLKTSPIFESLLHNFGIHVANFIFYVLGILGVYFLLKYLKISKITALYAINLIAIFPPILGARMILKPEIMAFAFLPWIILFIFKFYDEGRKVNLFLLIPFTAVLITSKASIALMIALSLVICIKKELFRKQLLYVILLFIPLVYLLFFESFQVNGNYVWDHKIPNGYDNIADLKFLFLINSDLISNPYRNSQANSMLGILFLDTFGDYWQRYWNHKDGWLGNQHPGNKNLNIIGIFISACFYIILLYQLFKEKNKKIKYIGSLSFVGLGVLLITIFNVFPFLTKNFNPQKGDPIKTHYFSFFLALSLIYLVIKLFSIQNRTISIIVYFLIFIFCLQITKGAPINEIRESQNSWNKIHLLSPCFLNDPISKFITYSDNWCSQEEISLSICAGTYTPSFLPVQKDDYLIFPKDDTYEQRNLVLNSNIVTVSNYYECLNYADGGYVLQVTEKYFFNSNRKAPIAFIFSLFSSILIIFYYIFFNLIKKEFKSI